MTYRKSVYQTAESHAKAVQIVNREMAKGLSDEEIAAALSSEYKEQEVVSLAQGIRTARQMPEAKGLRRVLMGAVAYLLIYKLLSASGVILHPSVSLGASAFLIAAAAFLPAIALYILYQEVRHAYLSTIALLIIPATDFVGSLMDATDGPGYTLIEGVVDLFTLAVYVSSIVLAWRLRKLRPDGLRLINNVLDRNSEKEIAV